jgi:hypothetical protein
VLAELARALGDARLARGADAERRQIVAEIGPEALGLDWTSDMRLTPPTSRERRRLAEPTRPGSGNASRARP